MYHQQRSKSLDAARDNFRTIFLRRPATLCPGMQFEAGAPNSQQHNNNYALDKLLRHAFAEPLTSACGLAVVGIDSGRVAPHIVMKWVNQGTTIVERRKRYARFEKASNFVRETLGFFWDNVKGQFILNLERANSSAAFRLEKIIDQAERRNGRRIPTSIKKRLLCKNQRFLTCVQISCSSGLCVVIYLGYMDAIPPQLEHILTAQNIVKIFVDGFTNVIDPLGAQYNLRVYPWLELQQLSDSLRREEAPWIPQFFRDSVDLKKLAAQVFPDTHMKRRRFQCRKVDWMWLPLAKDLFNVACLNSLVTIDLCLTLLLLAQGTTRTWTVERAQVQLGRYKTTTPSLFCCLMRNFVLL